MKMAGGTRLHSLASSTAGTGLGCLCERCCDFMAQQRRQPLASARADRLRPERVSVCLCRPYGR